MVKVPLDVGLDVALPNMSTHEGRARLAWTMDLDFTKRHWEYRGNRKVLGCNPAARMAYIGRVQSLEDAWLIPAPRDIVGKNIDLNAIPPSALSTRMDPIDFRIAAAFFAMMLERANISNIYVIDGYPNVSSDAAFNLTTDLLCVSSSCI